MCTDTEMVSSPDKTSLCLKVSTFPDSVSGGVTLERVVSARSAFSIPTVPLSTGGRGTFEERSHSIGPAKVRG